LKPSVFLFSVAKYSFALGFNDFGE
jgi:hypothetical protein